MANKKVVIEFDLDNSKLKIANEETLSLTQKIRLLKSELQKTKEGTKEFEILSKQLNNTKDDLARVSTKNRELLSTFSLIPGPIGNIFGKLNGVIGLLKTFSQFSLKDINSQLKGFNDDLNGIIRGFLGFKKVTDETNESISNNTSNTEDNSEAQQDKNDTIDEGTTATNAGTAANNAQTESLTKQQVEIKKASSDLEGFYAVYNRLDSAAGAGYGMEITSKEIEGVGDNAVITGANITDLDGITKHYTVEQLGQIDATKDLTDEVLKENQALGVMDKAVKNATIQSQQLTLAQQAAAFATNALSVALKGLGIGLVIGLVVALFEVLTSVGGAIFTATKNWIGYKTSAEKAAIANEALASSILVLKRSLDETQQSIKDQTDLLVIQAKTAGQTEEELFRIAKEGYDKRVQANIDGRKRIEAEYRTLQYKVGITEEERVKQTKALEDELVKNSTQKNDLRVEGQKLTANEELRIAEKKREDLKTVGDKGIADSKEYNDKIKADNNTADEALLTLLNENAALRQRDKRKREDEELKTAMEAEERAINALKISEEKKGILLNQIKIKYGYKVLDINDKRVEEDQKAMDDEAQKLREFNQKKQTILDEASANEIEKEKNTRKTTYENDLAELERDINFIKLSEDEKGKLRIALRTALNNDLKKIDDDAKEKEKQDKLKKIDDDIKFQEISNEANKNNFQEYFNGRQKLLELSKERELSEVEAGSEKALLIEKKYATLSKDLQKEKFQAVLGFIGQGLSAASNAISQAQQVNALAMQNELDEVKGNAEKEDKIKEKYFEKNKNTQIAQAIISTLQSAISAYSSLAVIPVVGPVLGGIAAAAALVFGYKQVALIKAQKYQSSSSGAASGAKPGKNYGDGGMIEGPRHSSGGVPITAEGGEAVMTRGSVTMFRPLLSMMNQMGGGTSFSKGAVGQSSFDNPKSTVTEPQIIKTYVVENELTSNQHRIARLKDLSTL